MRRESERRQKGQFGSLELCFGHIYIEGSIEQVVVVFQSPFDKCLQLRVGEDTSPGQIAETCRVGLREGVVGGCIADNAGSLHFGTLIVAIEALAAAQGEQCKG